MRMLHLVVALFAVCACADANDFYVDAGATAPGDGTAASPFPTIQQGVNAAVSGRGDRIFIQRGTYREQVGIAKDRLSLVGVGTATIEGQSTGIGLGGATNLTMENLVLRQCTRGVIYSGSNAVTFTRCKFVGNSIGVEAANTSTNFLFRECDFYNHNGIAVLPAGINWTFDRCTFAENATAINNSFSTTNLVLRNCIVAFNSTAGFAGTAGTSQPVLSYNDFFQNGADGNQHYGSYTPGASDLNVDPQLRDRGARDFSLLAGSPLVLAGLEDGLPATIGAHEIGVSAPLDTWTDVDGTPVTDPGSEVLFQNGALRLNGVPTASVLSPVIDLGDSGALTIRAVYAAFEDSLRPVGSRRVIDRDSGTFAREFRIRASPTAFLPLDPGPAWLAVTNDEVLSLSGQFVQMEFTLTTEGQ